MTTPTGKKITRTDTPVVGTPLDNEALSLLERAWERQKWSGLGDDILEFLKKAGRR